jgi:hypothetical protein
MITQEELRRRYTYDPDTGYVMYIREGTKAGWTNSSGYLCLRISGKQYFVHRLIWLYVHGVMPSGVIDHINQSKHDNRLCNLRDVPSSVNNHNTTRAVCGCRLTPNGRWQARIMINKVDKYLGTYDTRKEATAAYRTAKHMLMVN